MVKVSPVLTGAVASLGGGGSEVVLSRTMSRTNCHWDSC